MTQTEYSPLVGLVTIAEVADACRVSRQTIWRWVNEGKMPEPRRFGRRCIRWQAEVINEWIGQQNAANRVEEPA